jgi:hypothetical protein
MSLDVKCPECGALVLYDGNNWSIGEAIFACVDLKGTEYWSDGDVTYCPTIAKAAMEKGITWPGHTYRDKILQAIEIAKPKPK